MNVSTVKRLQKVIRTFKNSELNLEIGCGDKKHWRMDKDYIRVDVVDYGQDIVWDVEKGIPLPDNSCNYIYASHVFEHFSDYIGVVNECHRVLNKVGELYIVSPTVDSEKAFLPTHVNFFNKYTFDFFQYESYAQDYMGSVWKINELIVNDRKDIHIKMSPIK